MSLCHKLGFLNPNVVDIQTMNSGGSNNVSLIFERYAS